MKRLAQFLRSVIPADPWQLVFLLGVVLLHIFPRLPWRPVHASTSVLQDPLIPLQTDQNAHLEWGQAISIAVWPMAIASLVGYLTCFWPGRRPARRLLWGAILPALLTFCFLVFKLSQIVAYPPSVFPSVPNLARECAWLHSNFWNLPAGFYVSIVGLVLISVFTARLYLRLSSLPLSLPDDSVHPQDDSNSWPKVKTLIFVLIGPMFLLSVLSGLLFLFLYIFLPQTHSPEFGVASRIVTTVLDAVILVIFGLWFLDESGRKDARNSIQLPEPRFAFFAALLPIGICGSIGAAQYLIDRADWAAHYFGKISPPHFPAYFELAGIGDPWLLLLIFGALAEEIVFRGLFLPRLIDRYGFHRGTFLTGIVWAAIHFRFDHYWDLSTGRVFYQLAYRILFCLAMNYVFAWMTLRWKSVIPAAVAHSVSNILIIAGINDSVPWSSELRLAAWVVVGLLLFHYWPVSQAEPAEADSPVPPLEPAV
jgi:membrane protease YdiL (CAAX protease family)